MSQGPLLVIVLTLCQGAVEVGSYGGAGDAHEESDLNDALSKRHGDGLRAIRDV